MSRITAATRGRRDFYRPRPSSLRPAGGGGVPRPRWARSVDGGTMFLVRITVITPYSSLSWAIRFESTPARVTSLLDKLHGALIGQRREYRVAVRKRVRQNLQHVGLRRHLR